MARSRPRLTEANEFCREILPAVSRTFALSIRLLPGRLGDAVCNAYLICRIADTIEDEPRRPATEKAALFDALSACFNGPDAATSFVASASSIAGDPAHVRLVRNAGLVFEVNRSLSDETQKCVGHWAREMIAGMRKFSLAYPAGVRIQTLEEFREYCYYVAGTVGYMLTDLWQEHSRSIDASQYAALRQRCRAFGEALQTVNILKDVARDAEQRNSIYLPDQVLRTYGSGHATLLSPDHADANRAALSTIVQLAWEDLEQASAYLLSLPRRAAAVRLFCALPLLFAYATLRDLTRIPGALGGRQVVKIPRSEVRTLTVLAILGLFSNRWLARLIKRTRAR